jgi:hypothetical protein
MASANDIEEISNVDVGAIVLRTLVALIRNQVKQVLVAQDKKWHFSWHN